MPRLDHRLRLTDHLTPAERRLALLMLAMVNELRQKLEMPLLDERDVVRLLQHVLSEGAQ